VRNLAQGNSPRKISSPLLILIERIAAELGYDVI
jgi:hypothetical protein